MGSLLMCHWLKLFIVFFFRVIWQGINLTSTVIRFPDVQRAWRFAKWKTRLGELGREVVFHHDVLIHEPEKVFIGGGTQIGDRVQMWGGGGILIGENVLIAAHTVITSLTHDTHGKLYKDTTVPKEVRIGDNVWIGSSVVILPGVVIGDNAIVGAGGVVTKNVACGEIVVGVPAKAIGKNCQNG